MGKSAVETEGKFRVESLDRVRERLLQYAVEGAVEGPFVTHERNTMHDLCGILSKLGWTMRLRSNGGHYLTLKGENTGSGVNRRMELEAELPEWLYRALCALLPTVGEYAKVRESYVPHLSPPGGECTIFLDTVEGKGTFVEIEAESELEALLWKERLGITSENVSEPYYKL